MTFVIATLTIAFIVATRGLADRQFTPTELRRLNRWERDTKIL
ncbi:MAG: hypothetical protein ABJM29_15580 [Rhizobiaceae bacterium]